MQQIQMQLLAAHQAGDRVSTRRLLQEQKIFMKKNDISHLRQLRLMVVQGKKFIHLFHWFYILITHFVHSLMYLFFGFINSFIYSMMAKATIILVQLIPLQANDKWAFYAKGGWDTV